MAIIKKQTAYLVEIIESERGWGSKVDEEIYFDNEEEARQYVKEYNDKYNPPRQDVPDWYMVAQYRGRV